MKQPGANHPGSWSPDGKTIVFIYNFTVGVLDLDGGGKAQAYFESPFFNSGALLSADGHWLAYHSDESGIDEVYVRSFPEPSLKFQISTEGGAWPTWNRNGRELFYRDVDRMMAVEIQTQPTFSAGTPRLVFEGDYDYAWGRTRNYDVAPEGDQFLMIQSVEPTTSSTPIGVLSNFFDRLGGLTDDTDG